MDLHCSKFNKRNDKQHHINKLNTILDKTDSNICTCYASRGLQGGKRSFSVAVDLTNDSPVTNSLTAASSAQSTVSKKSKTSFQTTITNRYTSSIGTARSDLGYFRYVLKWKIELKFIEQKYGFYEI